MLKLQIRLEDVSSLAFKIGQLKQKSLNYQLYISLTFKLTEFNLNMHCKKGASVCVELLYTKSLSKTHNSKSLGS